MSSFATLAELKRYLSIGVDSHNSDEILQELLDRAEAYIESYCNRKLLVSTYTETITSPNAGRFIQTLQYPVRSVSSLKLNSMTINAASPSQQFGYVVDQYGIKLVGYCMNKGDWLEMSYTAGLDAVSDDVKQAAIKIAGLSYREMDRLGLVSKGLQSETTTYLQDLPKDVRNVLNQQKRPWSIR